MSARTFAQAPEIDGEVLLEGAGDLAAGEFVDVEITEAQPYDLIANFPLTSPSLR
jgi:ribosomal protein S12 methylthiotransferase